MRFLIITFDPPHNLGGVEGRAKAYTEQLLRRGNQVELIAFSPRNDFQCTNFNGAKLWNYPSETRFAPKSLRLTVSRISALNINCLFMLSGALTLYGLILLVYARIVGLKTGIFLYGKDILEAVSNPIDSISLFVSPLLAKSVLVNSRFTSSILPPWLRKKTRILYPGVDPALAEGELTQRSIPGRRILFVGRLVLRKGVEDLIEAFEQLRSEFPDSELEIVGEGPELQRLKNLANKIGISERVKFLGSLRGRKLSSSYFSSDIFVMSSKRTKRDVEGFGTVFLEAGLFGKPSVGTRSGGIPEAVIDGTTGILVEEGDISGLKAAIERLLKDERLRSRLGEQAKERILSEFTWEKSTNSLVSAFSDT